MYDVMWCPNCQTNRVVKMRINWMIFIVLSIFTFLVLGFIYFAYCYVEKQQCPVCEMSTDFMEPRKVWEN